MECLNLHFVRIGSKNTVRTARTPHRAITVWRGFVYIQWSGPTSTRLELIGSNGSINNYHFTDELVLTEGEIVGLQYGTTTGGFQQNFGVFTNFNNVFYDHLLSYFMPGFEQICSVANYCEKIQLSTTELQYLQPDLSFKVWHWHCHWHAGPHLPPPVELVMY